MRAAIERCLAAEAYTVRGRSKQSASLNALMRLEERLMNEVNAENDSGCMASVGRILTPT